MHTSRLLASFLLLVVSIALCSAQGMPSFAEPSISPDNTEVAFVSGGDIWSVPLAGGDAHLLVAHPANESRPLYSPDGKWLAFTSTRTGNGDVYALNLTNGGLKRLTFDDALEQVEGWSPDSHWVYFSSSSHDISGMRDILRVGLEGGTPMPVSDDRYLSEFFAAPAPDGKQVAFSARGIASGQWWRHGHSHIDESEIWVLKDIAAHSYERVVEGGAKNLWPMWSQDGHTLYFMSDRSGHENIWAMPVGGQAHALTKFESGRLLWPSISHDGRYIVFERNFGIWLLDLKGGSARELNIRLRGAPAEAAVVHRKFSGDIEDMALSPDGKKVAFIVHGEVFAASAKDGGDAQRVTNTASPEMQVTWAPDNRRIAYVSRRDGHDHIYLYSFADETERQLTSGSGEDDTPMFSPDGKLLAFQRSRKELVVVDLAAKSERVVASGYLDRPPLGSDRPFDWSPDSKWLCYTSYSARMFRNANVVRADGGESHAVTFLANVFSNSVNWSPDGKSLLMTTGQRTEGSHVARIDLVPHTPRFREDQFRDLFKEEKPPSVTPVKEDSTKESAQNDKQVDKDKGETAKTEPTKPEEMKGPKAAKTEVVFEGIRNRMTLLPVGADVSYQVVSPDGKWMALIANLGRQENVYAYSLDELSKEPPVAKQLTATNGRKSSLYFTPDSKEVFYLDDGKIQSVTLEAPKPKPLAVTAEMDVDFTREKSQVFEQAWGWLRDNFYDQKMKGLRWEEVRAEYGPRIEGARTPDEMRRIIGLMIGELNASHSGINPPPEENVTNTGRLGLRFDAAEYESKGKLRITEVIPLSPADVAGIKRGESLLAVDGIEMGRSVNLDEQLLYKIDKKVVLTIGTEGSGTRKVTLKPVRLGTEKGLLYREWVNQNRKYVEEISGGKLGYVHMPDMGENSLNQLFLDLDAETHLRQGVVIDIRNNNGGFVNAYALDVFSRRPYLNMTFRGFDKAAPARTILGQRSLELPTVLVTNQHSLSDAEDFTEGYRAMKLGKVVGEPTAGWIIYTSNEALMDGSILRIPFIRITAGDGSDMEFHPRKVDVEVQRAVGESYKGVDSQLDRAVKELLSQLQSGQLKAAGAGQ